MRDTAESGSQPRRVPVLQGGGALSVYQGEVYEALSDAGLQPRWVAGISIGAVNAAIIAGNPPELPVARLREFRELVSSGGAKDYEFSRPTMQDHWTSGVVDAKRSLRRQTRYAAASPPSGGVFDPGRDEAARQAPTDLTPLA
jgi:predicted acylesterase/phospholipase RssA